MSLVLDVARAAGQALSTGAAPRAAPVALPDDAPPIFFMHIAKTAGSYLNARFAEALGPDRTVTHIESSIGNSADLREKLDAGVQYFAGHIMLDNWNDIADPLGRTFRLITILRDPIDHLASHIQWLDHYNRARFATEYHNMPEDHRRIIDTIGAIDISDPGELDEFLTGLGGIGVRMFDNCQSRYFIASGRRVMNTIRPCVLSQRSEVARAFARFDAVIFQDALSDGLEHMSRATGVPLCPSEKRVNPAKSERRRRIDTTHPTVRQVLSKRTLLDQWLWRHAHEDAAKRSRA